MTSSRTDGISAALGSGGRRPAARPRPVHLQLRRLEHERGDQHDRRRPGHHRDGIQTTITLFTLTMAALMIPGSKLTDIWGRKVCFIARPRHLRRRRPAGGARAGPRHADDRLLAAGGHRLGPADPAHLHPGHRASSTTCRTRAKWFGVVSGAARPRRRRRAADRRPDHQLHQLAGVVPPAGAGRGGASRCSRGGSPTRPCRRSGRVSTCWAPSCRRPGCSSSSSGILQTGTYGWFTAKQDFSVGGTVVIPRAGSRRLAVRGDRRRLPRLLRSRAPRETARQDPAGLAISLFRNRTSNLGLVTQNRPVAGPAGLVLRDLGLPAAGAGLLGDPDRADAAARHDRHPAVVGGRPAHGQPAPPAAAHRAGFAATVVGLALLPGSLGPTRRLDRSSPGLFLMGFGVGAMLTAVGQRGAVGVAGGRSRATSRASRAACRTSARRSASRIAGSVLVGASRRGQAVRVAIVVVGAFAMVGWVAALLLPARRSPPDGIPGLHPTWPNCLSPAAQRPPSRVIPRSVRLLSVTEMEHGPHPARPAGGSRPHPHELARRPRPAGLVDFVARCGADDVPGRGAGRRVRQRRHALVREADADPARLHPAPARRDGRRRPGLRDRQPWKAACERDYGWLGR